MIPKIIHYCWLSNDPYPEELQKCMDTWKKKLPDYEFILWNFERFDKSSSKWVEQAFDKKKYAFAADYIRLFAVYNYGGIYMDMDIEVLRSFDDLLDSELMMAYENDEQNGIEAGCFGASKNNSIIKECLDYYTNRNFVKEDGSFDILPLPKIMIQTTSKYPELTIRDRYTFTCKSYYTGEITTKNYSYAIHNFAGSWLRKDDEEFKTIIQNIYKKYGKNSLSTFVIYLKKSKYLLHKYGLKELLKSILKKLKKLG